MKKNTNDHSWLSYMAIAISIFALIFSLSTYQDLQMTKSKMQNVAESIKLTDVTIQEDLERELDALMVQTDQTGEELETDIQNLRNVLASKYMNAEADVRSEWQILDAELEDIQAEAVDNTDSALERLQVILENLQSRLQ